MFWLALSVYCINVVTDNVISHIILSLLGSFSMSLWRKVYTVLMINVITYIVIGHINYIITLRQFQDVPQRIWNLIAY
jgi:hypothetical protein